MKVVIFVAVTLLALLGAALWFWGENLSLVTGGTLSAPPTSSIGSRAVSLALGDVLLLKTPAGDHGAVRLDRMTNDWGLDYTTWFLPASESTTTFDKQSRVRETHHTRLG